MALGLPLGGHRFMDEVDHLHQEGSGSGGRIEDLHEGLARGRDHTEFGTGPFGVDAYSGRKLMEWVRENYDVLIRVGAPPFKTRIFGTLILERRDRAAGREADS